MPQDRDDREADRADAARYVYDYATRAQMYATARDAAAAAGRPAPVFNDPKAPWNVLKNTAPATPTADPAADSPDHAARPAGHTSHAGETGYDTPSPTTGGPWEQTWNGTSWVWRAIGAGAGGGAGDGDRRLGSLLAPPTASSVAPWDALYPQVPDYPNFAAPSAEAMEQEPGFRFRMDQGRRALEASAAAKGILRAGGTLKDLLTYGQQFGANEYQNVFNRGLTTYLTNRDTEVGEWDRRYGRMDDILAGWRRQGQDVFDRLRWQTELGRDTAGA